MRDVEISVVHHQDASLVRRCLASLPRSCGGLSWHATVIDNGAGPALALAAAPGVTELTLLRNPRPLGFGANHNQVIDAVLNGRAARYVLVLNDDTELDPGAVAALVRACDGEPSIGAAAPLVVDERARTAWMMAPFPTLGSELRAALPRPPRLMTGGDGWLNGCCLLLRAQALREVGGFDERFFMFYEDIDLALRLRRHGWRRAVVGSARVMHRGHATVGRERDAVGMLQQVARSRHLFFAKHRGETYARAVSGLVRAALALRLLKARGAAWAGGRPGELETARTLSALVRYDPGAGPPRASTGHGSQPSGVARGG